MPTGNSIGIPYILEEEKAWLLFVWVDRITHEVMTWVLGCVVFVFFTIRQVHHGVLCPVCESLFFSLLTLEVNNSYLFCLAAPKILFKTIFLIAGKTA